MHGNMNGDSVLEEGGQFTEAAVGGSSRDACLHDLHPEVVVKVAKSQQLVPRALQISDRRSATWRTVIIRMGAGRLYLFKHVATSLTR